MAPNVPSRMMSGGGRVHDGGTQWKRPPGVAVDEPFWIKVQANTVHSPLLIYDKTRSFQLFLAFKKKGFRALHQRKLPAWEGNATDGVHQRPGRMHRLSPHGNPSQLVKQRERDRAKKKKKRKKRKTTCFVLDLKPNVSLVTAVILFAFLETDVSFCLSSVAGDRLRMKWTQHHQPCSLLGLWCCRK